MIVAMIAQRPHQSYDEFDKLRQLRMAKAARLMEVRLGRVEFFS
jgi:hypothetical protein